MSFRIWLESAEALPPAQFLNSDGTINLYRYSKQPRGETYRIDPAQARPSSYSMREFRTAGTPRTFFYLDPLVDKEQFIGNHLYMVRYPASKIYNLLTDPLGLKAQSLPNFDKLFELVRENGFDGVYYKPNMEIVSMLVPVLGHATTEEEVSALKKTA